MGSPRVDVVFRLWQCDKDNHAWREGADPRRNRAASLLVARPSRSRPTIDHYELSVSPSRPFCNYAHRFACFVNAPSELL
jgi:hypothetical protein